MKITACNGKMFIPFGPGRVHRGMSGHQSNLFFNDNKLHDPDNKKIKKMQKNISKDEMRTLEKKHLKY